MCISHVGNRRPFPVAGIARKPNNSNDGSLLSRVTVKDDVFSSSKLDLGAFEPKPMAPPSMNHNNIATRINNAHDNSGFALDEEVVSTEDSTTAAKSNQNAHIIVQHDYHDHSHDARALYQEEHPARGGVTTPFPLKLHEMLENVEVNGHEHIVSWQPHGRCFVVHKTQEFVELLPHYFKLSKLASFQRQLNLYGFQRLTRGNDKGGYYHELFLKSKVFLAHSIQRIKVKGTGVRARSNPDQEPNFWAMGWVSESSSSDDASDHTPSLSSPTVQKTIAQLPLSIDPPVPLMMTMMNTMSSSLAMPMAAAPWSSSNNTTVYNNSFDDDLVCAFGDKMFHFLPQTPPTHERPKFVASSNLHQDQGMMMDGLLASEAEAFFDDFDFPENIGSEIEDDNIFGDMLEQMIA